jgi:hypothetical protein
MKFYLLSLFIVIQFGTFGQTITGRIFDETTGESLDYVNIRVVGKNIGGISAMGGEFSIDVSKTQKTDTLKFSYIGYETFSLVFGKDDLVSRHIIKLKPKSTELIEVTIVSKNEFHRLGNQKVDRTYTGWGDFKSLKGRIRGMLIEGAECPVKVKSLSFRINHNEWDSVAFRINFLKVENGRPSETILDKNIFVVTSKKHKWVNIDLNDQNIILCNTVIATLEWVDAWGKIGEFNNLLTLSFGKDSGYTFSQEAGQEFGSLSFNKNSLAIYIEVYGD